MEDEEPWTLEQEKLFEKALACEEEDEDGDDDDDPDADFWERIAARVPGKNASQVEAHYGLLIQDVDAIDSGLIPLPPYPLLPARTGYDPDPLLGSDDGAPIAKKGEPGSGKGYSKSAHQERRKGIPWSEEEHRLFLLGLAKFGKGDWRSISRNYVITRTPTQVASHAQKYFIRMNSMNRDRRRSSIHDITSVNNGEASQTSQGPITGQGAVVVGQASTSHSITAGAPPPPLPAFPNGAMYGGAPTLGTPILPPPPGVNGPYMAGGPPILRPPSGSPMAAVMQVSYPMSQPMVQR